VGQETILCQLLPLILFQTLEPQALLFKTDKEMANDTGHDDDLSADNKRTKSTHFYHNQDKTVILQKEYISYEDDQS